jgi:two-component system, LuxR family, response regulator FixJ
MKKEPVVYIVDAEKECCEMLARQVQSIGLASRTFNRADEFLKSYDSTQPGCLVVELRLPEISGLMLFEILRDRHITLPTIFLTAYGTVSLAVKVMKMGAFDFMEKPFDHNSFIERMEKAILLDRQRLEDQEKKRAYHAQIESLSPRECQILNAIISGKNNKMIALELNISHKTVEFHRTNIMRKLKAETLVELTKNVLLLSDSDSHSFFQLGEGLRLKQQMETRMKMGDGISLFLEDFGRTIS